MNPGSDTPGLKNRDQMKDKTLDYSLASYAKITDSLIEFRKKPHLKPFQ